MYGVEALVVRVHLEAMVGVAGDCEEDVGKRTDALFLRHQIHQVLHPHETQLVGRSEEWRRSLLQSPAIARQDVCP